MRKIFLVLFAMFTLFSYPMDIHAKPGGTIGAENVSPEEEM